MHAVLHVYPKNNENRHTCVRGLKANDYALLNEIRDNLFIDKNRAE